MRALLLVALLLLAASAAAFDTITIGRRVLSVGDPTGKVIEIAGNPDTKVDLQNKLGASVGERWEYYRDGKTILVTLSGGRVVALEEVRN